MESRDQASPVASGRRQTPLTTGNWKLETGHCFLASDIEGSVLAVRSVAGIAAAEVSRRDRLPVALKRQQLDEPGFVLDFLVEDAGRHVIGPGILAEGHVADLDPGADGAAF